VCVFITAVPITKLFAEADAIQHDAVKSPGLPADCLCVILSALCACGHVGKVSDLRAARISPEPGSRPIFAYAHSVFATFCALKVPAIASARSSSSSARPSSTRISPTPGSRPIVAYAHSVFATCCASKVHAIASARPSRMLTSPAPGFHPIVAYVHSVFATCCASKVPAITSARPSSTRLSPAPGSRRIVAYAHSGFATFCALNVPAIASAHVLRDEGARGRRCLLLQGFKNSRDRGMVAAFGHGVQGGGKLLWLKVLNFLECTLLQRLQCSLYNSWWGSAAKIRLLISFNRLPSPPGLAGLCLM